eukprot:10930253-Ditylum_brightwellii.AAC.1
MEINIRNLEMKEMNTEAGNFDVDSRSENSAISDTTAAPTNVTIDSSFTSATAASSLSADGLSSRPSSSLGGENSSHMDLDEDGSCSFDVSCFDDFSSDPLISDMLEIL